MEESPGALATEAVALRDYLDAVCTDKAYTIFERCMNPLVRLIMREHFPELRRDGCETVHQGGCWENKSGRQQAVAGRAISLLTMKDLLSRVSSCGWSHGAPSGHPLDHDSPTTR